MGEPAHLPSFKRLAELIAAGTAERQRENEPEDRFLGRLQHKGVDVHARAVKELSRNDLTSTALHRDLLRLYPTIEQVRVVTTNFDLLFEHAAPGLFGSVPEIFRAPALPLGRHFHGIVHVHGAVSHPKDMVLTDADFGRAYLIEGWARRFLLEVFRYYTVLFVGYGHNDVVMHYLARALPESAVGRRFALVEGANNLQHWQVLGINPSCFPSQAHRTSASSTMGLAASLMWRGAGSSIGSASFPIWQRSRHLSMTKARRTLS